MVRWRTAHLWLGLGLLLLAATPLLAWRWPAAAAPGLTLDARLVQPGDIIFRANGGLTSRTVRALSDGGRYSHVGIIVRGVAGPEVVHAMPPEGSAGGRVLREPLAAFVAPASAIGVYRLAADGPAATAAAAIAAQHAAAGTPFDAHFDLVSDDAVYCTEFVWKVFRAAGSVLLSPPFDALDVPLLTGSVILPSSLAASERLVPVITVNLTAQARVRRSAIWQIALHPYARNKQV